MAQELSAEPIIIVSPASIQYPPGNPTVAEWNALVGRVTEVEGMGLVDLSDVDADTPADGMALVYDAATQSWKPGSVQGKLEEVRNANNTTVIPDVHTILAGGGLDVIPSDAGTPGLAYIVPLYGTGSRTVAEGDHTHAIRPDAYFTFPASGSFSSGTRSLVSGTVTGLDPAKTYVLKGTLDVHLRGDGTGAGYTRPRITINGNSVDMPERPRNVAGVQPCYTMRHPGVLVTGVSSVTVSGAIVYSEGDPTWVGGGALTIEVIANR